MSLREFIKQNRVELDHLIRRQMGHVPSTASCYCPKNRTEHWHQVEPQTYSEIRQWILNDESLYRWAQSEGVRI